eukprot:10758552-Heterocapsa_arctica.AAC.1
MGSSGIGGFSKVATGLTPRLNALSLTSVSHAADLHAMLVPASASACCLALLVGKPYRCCRSRTGPGMPGIGLNLSLEKLEQGYPACAPSVSPLFAAAMCALYGSSARRSTPSRSLSTD